MNANTARVSVVIPAHDEGPVIERCLRAMLCGAAPGEFEVVVVANGCTDDTAERARRFPVTVIEVAEPSKANALQVGDSRAHVFPRVYLDADVTLGAADLRTLGAVLEEPGALAAAPRLVVELGHTSYLVRSFYSVWLRHPYHRDSMIGSGVYALSRAGRERFGTFPRQTADDAFVHRLFAADERRVAKSATFRITAPRDLASLIAIKTRSRRGNLELDATHCRVRSSRFDLRLVRFLVSLLLRPWCWPACVVYAWVVAVTSVRARAQLRRGANPRWERDLSSRTA